MAFNCPITFVSVTTAGQQHWPCRTAAAAAMLLPGLQWGSYAAPYGAEKAKMNALMAMVDSELQLCGITGVSVQVGLWNSYPAVVISAADTTRYVHHSICSVCLVTAC
jgi:hypothetical protein